MPKDILTDDLNNHFSNLESEYNLPNGLLKAVAKTESRFDSKAVSPKGAQGMFQFMPDTAKQFKVDVNDPYSSANGAAKYYSQLLKAYDGDIDKALAGYNWGQGNVNKKGIQNAPEETRNYISKVKGFMGNNTEKKNMNDISPETWAAFDEMETLRKNGSQASLSQQDLSQSKNVETEHASAMPQFSPEQWAAFDAMNQKQAPELPNIPPKSALTPQGGMPPANPVQAVQGQPKSAQNVMSTQAQGINFNQNVQSSEQIGQALVGRMMQIQDPNKIADFMRTRSPSEQLYMKKEIARLSELDPSVHASGLSNFIEGVARVGRDMRNSVEQAGNGIKGFITRDYSGLENKNREIANARIKDEIIDTADPSKARTAGEVTGYVASALGAPAGRVVTAGASTLSKVLGSKLGDLALKGAGSSMLAAPVVDTANPEKTDVLTGKLKQAALGAGLGAGVGYAAEKVIGKIAKPFTAKVTSADELAQKQAQEAGITLTAGELPSADLALKKQTQNFARDNATVRDLVTKNEKAAQARAEELGQSIGKIDKSNYLKNKGLDKIASDSSNKYNYAAKDIESKLSSLDTDNPEAVLKLASEANYLSKKIANNAEYDEVAKLAPIGYKLELNNAKTVLKTAQDELEKMGTPELKRQFAPIVKNIEDSLASGKIEYTHADQLFKEFGVLARQAVKTGDDNGARVYNELKKAINTDKDAFVNSLPSDPKLQAYKDAYTKAKFNNMNNIQNVKNDNGLRNLMEPFSRNGNPNLPDNLISNLVKKGNTEKVKILYNSIDDEAKDAIANGVYNKILAKAKTADGGFSPKAFNKAYREYANPANGNTPLDIVFSGAQGAKLKNLMEIFDNMHTVGFNRINPQNGLQAIATMENLHRTASVVGAGATGGASLISPIVTQIRKMGIAKFLSDPKYNKLMLDIKNTNPKAQKYLEKVSELTGLLSSQETAKTQ